MATNNAINVATGASGTLLQGNGVGVAPTFATTLTGNLTFSGFIQLTGGLALKYTSTAISYNVLVTDQIIGVTSTAAARTITMPNAGLTTGQVWIIKDESVACSVNNITISGNGANIIADVSAASYVMNNNGAAVQIYYNGTNFVVV